MTPKQRREAAILKQQAIVNAARADGGRALTAEEQVKFNNCQREIEQADAEIKAQERGLSYHNSRQKSVCISLYFKQINPSYYLDRCF